MPKTFVLLTIVKNNYFCVKCILLNKFQNFWFQPEVSAIIAHIEAKNKAKNKVTETKIDPPSRRSNFTFVTHPDKDEIILFGGEFHNGKNVCIIL